MKIEIDMHSAAPGVAGELRKFVEHHVRCSLAQVRLHVERVLVRLTDLNGPQGSFDQLCAVQVRIAGQRPVMVRDVRPDMRTAIARAVERAGLNSLRRLRQRQLLATAMVLSNASRTPGPSRVIRLLQQD